MQTNDTLDYLVSQGFSETILDRFWSRVKKTENCWLWTGSKCCGYGKIGVGGHRGAPAQASRVSWMIHYGAIPDGLWVLHDCDNPPCVRPDHLFLGTHQDNMADMTGKNRGAKGETLGKLKESDVIEILKIGKSISQEKLSRMFNINRPEISYILRGKLWKHARPDLPRHNTIGPGNAKINESSVIEIIRLGKHCSKRELAERFNVSLLTIARILCGKSWKHVPR